MPTYEELAEQNAQLKIKKEQLEFENTQLKKLIYGTKSERFKSEEVAAEQLNLFIDPIEEQASEQVSVEVEQISYDRKKGKTHKGRNKLPEHLPTREVIIEPEEDTTDMTKIGEQITETLEYTPASLVKVITIRPKYVSKEETEENSPQLCIAPLPERAIDKCIAEPSLLTYIIVSKFIDHLPFYRQIQRFKRDFRWEPSKSTVNDWFIAVCTLLEPLYQVLQNEILQSTYIHADESPIKVQDKTKSGKTHLGYQWVYLSPAARLVLFQYHRSRSIQAPKELLQDYKGYLQCDGYKVYDKLEKINPDIQLVGCWAHARRKYHEALQSDPQRSQYALQLFKSIYKHEALIKEQPSVDRKTYRNTHILPLFTALHEWIQTESIKVLPKSPIGKAMTYTQNQWPKLIAVLHDGQLELDNNHIENKIRPLALGRKNYLFAGSHPAAQRIAMMYSFFASCKINEINPQDWMAHVLDNIKQTKYSDLHQLLPNTIQL